MTEHRQAYGGAGPRASPDPDAFGCAFSVQWMDTGVPPAEDFYRYAAGTWLKNNPVPSDKTSWDAFGELQERTLDLLRGILERSASAPAGSTQSLRRQVGDFYASAMNTDHLEAVRFRPLEALRASIENVRDGRELAGAIAALHSYGIPGLFQCVAEPDLKESTRYALYFWQAGLSLPNREYYLAEEFAQIRGAYRAHVARMFTLWGVPSDLAETRARTVLEIETELARASRTPAELRQLEKNYSRREVEELNSTWPALHLERLLADLGLGPLPFVVVGQPEFFDALHGSLMRRPLADWKALLSWNLLHTSAPQLHEEVEAEDFAFFHRALLGQVSPEPRWKRATRMVDAGLGEALGQLYVEEQFPPSARERMDEMVRYLSAVFHDRLEKLDWMTEATRRAAIDKFDRFVAHIGHPATFRDYSSVSIDPGDLWGNVRRAAEFEVRRRLARVGGRVDRFEWMMTPPTVNAYFDPTQNQIFFPAGILQPPFFDPTVDDAVNFGAIGAVIGHEITHGYDDQGRKSDADGNLRDWWTSDDAQEFAKRAEQVVRRYEVGEPFPGVHVNGSLTLGENIADFGGVSIAFEALQRKLSENGDEQRPIDGLTPEQRFFISWAQIWRSNYTSAELRRRLLVDPHSPGRYRAVVPLENLPAFREAFGLNLKERTPVRIW